MDTKSLISGILEQGQATNGQREHFLGNGQLVVAT